MAAGLLLAAASSASAQFTLTFNDAGTCASGTLAGGCNVSGTYGSVSGVNADGAWSVGVTDGYSTSLGGAIAGSMDVVPGNYVGEVGAPNYVADINDYPNDAFGEFDFTPGGASNFVSIESVQLGLIGNCCASIYDDIYIYNGASIVKDSVLISQGTSPVTVNLSLLAGTQDLSGVTKLFFGESPSSFATNPLSSSYFTVDNVTFDSEAVAPEPGALALLGTGILGLAPMMVRRRRRIRS